MGRDKWVQEIEKERRVEKCNTGGGLFSAGHVKNGQEEGSTQKDPGRHELIEEREHTMPEIAKRR